ncbi:Single-pass membrane and coiled-coil domain-containing protein 4-like protein [Armadillidium nasatum]|uniref:Single-pass membrane and coiled-coil domain-containing protein 4 homolog n=1 Tax=Armadillidium nasatum TaxID=96803 RepID=A0A5N5T830_9CRUS|nr:Single-pass membrane and coiled-coil domain-containing protein 4-like protein [Armadillidium nasatum]
MRQLKGKVKENAREKRERKKDFMENKEKVFTIVLPVVLVISALVVIYVQKPSIRAEPLFNTGKDPTIITILL